MKIHKNNNLIKTHNKAIKHITKAKKLNHNVELDITFVIKEREDIYPCFFTPEGVSIYNT